MGLSVGMRKLQDLSLGGCDTLSGVGLAHLAPLTALTSLSLEQWRDLSTLQPLCGECARHLRSCNTEVSCSRVRVYPKSTGI